MRKNTKVLGLLISLLALSGCNGDTGLTFKASFKMSYFDSQFESVEKEYKFNIKDFLKIDESPIEEKAKTGLLFINNIFEDLVIEKELKVTSEDFETLYKKFELDDFERIAIQSSDGIDVNDVTTIHFAHKKVENTDVGFITIQESGGGIQWASNFDVGADNPQYTSLTGEHPDWLNHKNHKGFDVAANRTLPKINDYISRKMDKNSQQILYIFGLSRGGAVGNIIAKNLIDGGKRVNAYLYSSPSSTTASDVADEKYKTIFNYVNDGDFITQLLLKEWGFDRYGSTIKFNLVNYVSELKEYCNITYSPFPVGRIIGAFKKISSSREDLYITSDKIVIAESTSLKENEVDAFIKQYTDIMVGEYEVLKKTIKIDRTDNGDGTFSVKITAAPSLLTSVLGITLTHLGSQIGNIKDQLSSLLPLLQPFLDIGNISMIDIVNIGANLQAIVYNHAFPAYVSYFFRKNK